MTVTYSFMNVPVAPGKAITPSSLIKPLKPSSPILCKSEQEFSFMTPIGDMPNLSRDVVSFGSGH